MRQTANRPARTCRQCGAALPDGAPACRRCGAAAERASVIWLAALVIALAVIGIALSLVPDDPGAPPPAAEPPRQAGRPAEQPDGNAVEVDAVAAMPPAAPADARVPPEVASEAEPDLRVPPPDLAERGCVIKATKAADGSLVYYLPDAPGWAETPVDPAAGDRWYCDENEAIEAGYGAP
jgi:hypothetical protein